MVSSTKLNCVKVVGLIQSAVRLLVIVVVERIRMSSRSCGDSHLDWGQLTGICQIIRTE